jgi:hypothetical protein
MVDTLGLDPRPERECRFESCQPHMKYICDNSRHLICEPYSVENLHKMAEDLDIKKCWYHTGGYPHYDIPKKRIEEIQSKCEVVTSRELLQIIKLYL